MIAGVQAATQGAYQAHEVIMMRADLAILLIAGRSALLDRGRSAAQASRHENPSQSDRHDRVNSLDELKALLSGGMGGIR